MGTDVGSSLGVCCWAKCFTFIILGKPHNTPVTQSIPISQLRKLRFIRWIEFLKVTQQMNWHEFEPRPAEVVLEKGKRNTFVDWWSSLLLIFFAQRADYWRICETVYTRIKVSWENDFTLPLLSRDVTRTFLKDGGGFPWNLLKGKTPRVSLGRFCWIAGQCGHLT